MRTRIIYSIFALLIIVAGCRKSDNPELPSNLQRAPIPQFSVDSSTDLLIPGQNPASFSTKVTLDQYWKTDHSYKSFNLIVRKNGDNGKLQTLQTDITQLPATITITGDELEKAFGASIVSTDFFDIGADVILPSGQTIEAFPSDGYPNYDPNINTLPNLKPFTLNYGVFCNYDPSVYDGNFVVVEDDWADYQPGDVIPITKIDNTHFSFKYAAPDATPIIIAVDPVTNVTSVADQYFGNYGGGFGNWYLHSTSSANNYVLPCQGIVSVVFDIRSDVLGDEGNARLILKKQ